MPLSPPVAVRIADLNTQNQLSVQYTPEMVLQHQDRYLTWSGENSELMGVVEAKPVQWYQCEIDHLSVHPEFTQRGVGSRLLEAAEARAGEFGARIAQCTITGWERRERRSVQEGRILADRNILERTDAEQGHGLSKGA